jgi:hypothetical protein
MELVAQTVLIRIMNITKMKRNVSFAVTQAMELDVLTVQRKTIGMAAERINVFGVAILPRVAAAPIVQIRCTKNKPDAIHQRSRKRTL